MRKLILICSVFASFSSLSQEPEISLSGLGIRPISSIHLDDGNSMVIGSAFLSDEWNDMQIKMIGLDKIHQYPSKINLKLDLIHVKIRGQEYAIKPSNIDYLLDTINTRKFIYEQGIKSLVEVIYSADSTFLFKQFLLKLKKGNYNPALDAGEKYDELIQESVYFVSIDGNLHELKNKKGLNKFLKEQGFNVKNSSIPDKNNEKQLINLLSNLK
ncbi:hypothetical protein [Ekhidna sp.]|uniref:hypothetical protein n=1 Tax=Ekhidna sp. TaxID=2608089 RepID=UPI0032EE1D4E